MRLQKKFTSDSSKRIDILTSLYAFAADLLIFFLVVVVWLYIFLLIFVSFASLVSLPIHFRSVFARTICDSEHSQ